MFHFFFFYFSVILNKKIIDDEIQSFLWSDQKDATPVYKKKILRKSKILFETLLQHGKHIDVISFLVFLRLNFRKKWINCISKWLIFQDNEDKSSQKKRKY